MNRREFLRPLPPTPDEEPPGELTLLRVARRAMATRFEFLLPFGLPHAQDAALAGLDTIDRLEAQLTVFRDTSEVSRLNRLAADVPVPVEAGLFDLLALSERLNRDTEGAFDITTGPLIKAWGFYRRQGRVPGDAELAAARDRVGMTHLRLDPERRTVRYLRRGLEINLGAIGKGYALDRVAEGLRDDWGVPAALLHGGGSSVRALGAPAEDPRGWAVGVRHPWNDEARLAVVRLRDRALGTSAATFQHFEYNGRKLGHVIDPRTGWPAEDVASASVIAPTAAEADALSTAFFILGVDAARRYCAEHPEVAAVMLPAGGLAEPVVINVSPADCTLVPLPGAVDANP
jgi:thiamine biosynthesis lipoprotein